MGNGGSANKKFDKRYNYSIDNMKTYTGTIKRFIGSWESGLGYLIIETKNGDQKQVPCENGPTVRALEDAFGNVITAGHTAGGGGGCLEKGQDKSLKRTDRMVNRIIQPRTYIAVFMEGGRTYLPRRSR